MNIQKRVYEHYQYVDNYNYTRFFTALQGSQNYGLADDESDIDTKTLIIPNYKELVFNAKPVSSTIIVEPTAEHADVKDIRLMFDTFRKQNINFLEILFTPYVVVTGGYKIYYHSLWNKREDIAHLNPYRNLSSMVGHMYEKYKKFEHPFPSAVSKIEKFGYDPKQLHHMVRIKDFLERFFEKGAGGAADGHCYLWKNVLRQRAIRDSTALSAKRYSRRIPARQAFLYRGGRCVLRF